MSTSYTPGMARADWRAPFFVVGSQRSGTTLLRLMLDHHPEIAVPHEFDYAVEAVRDDGSFPTIETYRRFLDGHGSYERSGLRFDPTLDYPALMESFLRQRQGSKPIVGMTVHRHYQRLLFLWPQARFVWLVRDPRAVARSVVQVGWSGNVWAAADIWLEAQKAWQRLREAIPSGRWTEVRYEDLVCDPEATLSQICRFLGVEYSPKMLTYPQDTTYDAPDPGAAERWRDQLGLRACRRVEERVDSWLERSGYVATGIAPLAPPSRAVAAALRLHDRLGRLRFRLRRYGIPLTLADYAGRRLGIRSLERLTSQRIRRIADQHVR